MLRNSRSKRNIEEQQNQERHWSIGAQEQRKMLMGKGEKTKTERKGAKINAKKKAQCRKPLKTQVVN